MNTEDDWEQWLAPRSPAGAEPTAEELFARTRPILRRRVLLRWLSRGLLVLALLAVGYTAGFLTAPAKTVVVEVPLPAVALPEVPPLTVPVPPAPVLPEPSATQLELQAELSDVPAETAALYRQAGDKYLTVERDYPRATRCYRQHLQALDQKSPPLDANDTWLLASLKPQPR